MRYLRDARDYISSHFSWPGFCKFATLNSVGGDLLSATIASLSPNTIKGITHKLGHKALILAPTGIAFTLGVLKECLANAYCASQTFSQASAHVRRKAFIQWFGALAVSAGLDVATAIIAAQGNEDGATLMTKLTSANLGALLKPLAGFLIGKGIHACLFSNRPAESIPLASDEKDSSDPEQGYQQQN